MVVISRIAISLVLLNLLVSGATPEEKLAVWPTILAVHAGFDEYQARTDRDIPVLICMPV